MIVSPLIGQEIKNKGNKETKSFAIEFNQQTNKFYSIGYSMGIGASLNYKDNSLGSMIDYYNLFHFQSRPFDNLLIKLGFGFNYNTNPITDQMTANFSFTTSIGYIYIQNQSHKLSHLEKFGAGFTIDYIMINPTSHGVGITVYTMLDRFLLGLGGGAIIPSNEGFQPYVMGSIGFFK